MSPVIAQSTCLQLYFPVYVLTSPVCVYTSPVSPFLCPPVPPAPCSYCSFCSISLSGRAACSSDGLKSWQVVGYVIGGCDQHRAVPAASSDTPVAPTTETLPCISIMSRCALHCVAKIKKLIKKLFFGRKNTHFIFCGNHRVF